MAGQAILGDTLLKQEKASDAAAPGESLEALVAAHMRMVFRIAYSILRNHHDAEDAAQECFLRALRFKERRGQVRNAKTWLARIAWTTALDRRAARASVEGHESPDNGQGSDFEGEDPAIRALEQFADRGPSPDQQLAGRQMQDLLERLIAGLPDELRRTLELSTVEELNSTEVAEVLEIPEGSVRTRLLRARRLLKEKLSALMEVKRHV